MAKKIFKEKQRFGGPEVICLLVFFIAGLTYRFVSQHWINPVDDSMSALTYATFALPLIAAVVYLINVQLSVKVTDKSISFKYSPFINKKHKVKWSDVEECEFVAPKDQISMSGWDVHFNNDKRFSLTGKTGVHLKTKDGENISFGVKDMKGLKNAIMQAML